MKNIAIFASGSGSNAENLIRFFRTHDAGQVKLVLSNRSDAYVLKRAQSFNIETVTFDRDQFYRSDEIVTLLIKRKIDFVILAGFLWLVPLSLIRAFGGRIINIHPALLPKYGGKGMYGHHVHEAVIRNNDTESGITIHYVNEKYDDGAVIFQATCPVSPEDDADSLAEKVHELEYEHFPRVVEQLLNRF